MTPRRSILIVGGGTAGWMTAAQDLPSHRSLIHQVYNLGFTDKQAVSLAGAPVGGRPFA